MVDNSREEIKKKDKLRMIKLRNVYFSYGNKAFSLKNINMHIKAGEKIAIVGKSGSGKSTLIHLLLNLYKPDGGSIILKDRNQETIVQSYCNGIGLGAVLQDFQLYATRLGNNISMNLDFEADKAVKAAKKAKFDDALINTPKQLDTELTKEFYKEGVELSGGESQRLALSRSFYADKNFYIIDEPTSTLDIKQEEYFNQLIDEVLVDKAIIFTSHRLSTVTSYNRIYYM